jgi:hypothetical protein
VPFSCSFFWANKRRRIYKIFQLNLFVHFFACLYALLLRVQRNEPAAKWRRKGSQSLVPLLAEYPVLLTKSGRFGKSFHLYPPAGCSAESFFRFCCAARQREMSKTNMDVASLYINSFEVIIKRSLLKEYFKLSPLLWETEK